MAIIDLIKKIQAADAKSVTPGLVEGVTRFEISNPLINNDKERETAVTPVTPQNIAGVTKKHILNNAVTPVTPVTPKNNETKKISCHLTKWQTDTLRKWLTEIGEPEEDHGIVFSKCRSNPGALEYFLNLAAEHGRQHRREKVLQMLADNPEIRRVFLTDTESDPGNVILTMAICGMASFEMLIPRDKYDPFMLIELIEKGSVQ